MTRIYVMILILIGYGCLGQKEGTYVCEPCDLSCDTLTFSKPGICPHCKMKLVNKSKLVLNEDLKLNEISIKTGKGKYLIEGGREKEKTVIVHYYKPEDFSVDSNIIMVMPGAGRNGDDYRDAWIERAEEYNLLVLSPEYAERYYPEFWSYNLAGMISEVEINAGRTAMVDFSIVQNSDAWLFDDFDRIFELVKEELKLTKEKYDAFGHSAGGQILHRSALFNPDNKMDRILSSNSGWYTVPNDTIAFPYGLKNLNLSLKDIDFSQKLIVFLGEMDNANETRGDLRHVPEMDNQGLHRLSRGKYFFNMSRVIAKNERKNFRWEIKIISDVGHDYRKMSEYAADFFMLSEWNGPSNKL